MLVFPCHIVTCTAFLSLNAIKSALWVFKVLIILCVKHPHVSEGSPQPPLGWGFSLKGRKGEGMGEASGEGGGEERGERRRKGEKEVEKGGG